MHIYAINNIKFTSTGNYKKFKNVDSETLDKIKNSAKDGFRKDFYANIDAYINRQHTKKEYLANINKLAHRIDNKVKLNDAEKQYISDMLTTMDLTAKSENISDKYLIENISELIKNQQ